TAKNKADIKSKFKTNMNKCDFSDIKQVSVLKQQATQLKSIGMSLDSKEFGLDDLKSNINKKIKAFEESL